MDGPGFPLHDLPDIALEKVFKFMTPLQLWYVSKEKPRCQHLTKNITFEITDIQVNPNFILVDYAHQQTDLYNFGSSTSEEEWRSTVSSVSKFLRRGFATLNVETADFESSWAWINSDHQDVKTLNLTVLQNEENPQKVLKTISKNGQLKWCSQCLMKTDIPENLECTVSFNFKRHSVMLAFEDSSWLTVQNIIESNNFSSFEIRNSTFWDDDLNRLLKTWRLKNKHFPTSRRLNIEKSDKQRIDVGVLLKGLFGHIRQHYTCPLRGEVYALHWNNDEFTTIFVKENSLRIAYVNTRFF